MKKWKEKAKQFLCGILAILMGMLPGLSMLETTKAATMFTEQKMSAEVEAEYKWTMHFRDGITKAEPFGSFSNEAWKQYTNNGAADYANRQMVALTKENSAGNYGVWYRNIGQYQDML